MLILIVVMGLIFLSGVVLGSYLHERLFERPLVRHYQSLLDRYEEALSEELRQHCEHVRQLAAVASERIADPVCEGCGE